MRVVIVCDDEQAPAAKIRRLGRKDLIRAKEDVGHLDFLLRRNQDLIFILAFFSVGAD